MCQFNINFVATWRDVKVYDLEFMFQTFKSLIVFPLQLHSSLSLCNAYKTIPGARFNIPLSCICTVAYEVDFRPRQSANILQYMDFFTSNRGQTILTDSKQLHCRLMDANYF